MATGASEESVSCTWQSHKGPGSKGACGAEKNYPSCYFNKTSSSLLRPVSIFKWRTVYLLQLNVIWFLEKEKKRGSFQVQTPPFTKQHAKFPWVLSGHCHGNHLNPCHWCQRWVNRETVRAGEKQYKGMKRLRRGMSCDWEEEGKYFMWADC